MILGFGQIETDLERAEGEWVDKFLKSKLTVEHSFIPDSIVRELETQLRIRSEQLKRVAEIYKTATKHPDRYSTLWFSVLHDASNVVVIFRFQHINRRHPMSPDGWASMTSKYVHHFSMLD